MIAELPNLLVLQRDLHDRVNDLRSLQRLVTQPDFEFAFKNATEDQKRIALGYINEGKREAVQQWVAIQERNRQPIEDLPVKELRRLAGSLGIAGYQFLNKASLLSEIASKELP